MSRWLVAFVTGALLIGALAVGCGDDDDDGNAATSTAEERPPSEVLAEAADTFAALDSFHFTLTHENGATPFVFDLDLREAEGDIAAPDSLRTHVKADRGAVTVELDVVNIGEDIWVTDPFSGQWQKIDDPDFDIGDLFDPQAGIPDVLRGLQNAEMDGTERIGDVETIRFRGTVDGGDIRAIAPIAEEGIEVPVVVWVGRDDGLVHRVRTEGRLSEDESDEVRRQIDLSEFNEPVEIEPPV
ncbi:MAG TPA: LppX_LprAFG lipoprotein [Dehalococcoidia bacterium]|nr:LppX_LprAFG lipoprotein [Dehalococcoidia bacterium]